MTPPRSLPLHNAKIALVSMPFASAQYSSLALSLLSPLVEEIGHQATGLYYNLRYAGMVGVDLYEQLAADQQYNLGEQAFSEVRFPGRSLHPTVRAYLHDAVKPSFFAMLTAKAEILVEAAASEIMRGEYDLVGFTTTFYQKMAALAVANRLRDKGSSAMLVMGGAACESPMGEALLRNFPEIDAVFHGDAELSLPTFLKASAGLVSIESVRSVSFRDADGSLKCAPPQSSTRDLSTPPPRYDDYIRGLETNGLLDKIDWFLSYETSRGCWWGEKSHCTFCGLNGLQMVHREKVKRDVVADLRRIRNDYGPVFVHFADNIIHFSAVKDLLPQLEDIEGQKYFAEVKSNLKETDFIAMARAGMLTIQPGIERLNDVSLKLMGKGVSAIQNVQTLRMATEFGIRPRWNVIVGFPGEKLDNVLTEIQLIKSIFHLPAPEGCSFIRLDRYSPNYKFAERLGIKNLGPSQAEAMMFFGLPHLDDMAYHFEYELIDPPTMELANAWKTLKDIVEQWISEGKSSSLVLYEDGNDLVVQDFRSRDSEEEIVLSGIASEIYRECLAVTPVAALCKAYPDARCVMDDLEKRGLLLTDGVRALALAVRDRAMIAKVKTEYQSLRGQNCSSESKFLRTTSQVSTALNALNERL